MPRLRNARTGVVVNVSEETAARLRAGIDKWESAEVKPKRSRKKSDDDE